PNSFLNPPLIAPPIPPGFFSSFFSSALAVSVFSAGLVEAALSCFCGAAGCATCTGSGTGGASVAAADEAPLAFLWARLSLARSLPELTPPDEGWLTGAPGGGTTIGCPEA